MRHFLPSWKALTNDASILQCIKGYIIPFESQPHSRLKNIEPRLSSRERFACESEIYKLLEKGAISICEPCKDQFISPYFLIPKANGDLRFILNLKELNSFIVAPHFKMEDKKTAIRLMRKDSFMASIDLKDSYFLIPVEKSNRKYLRFSYQKKLYEFNCIPFGLCTAPFLFTKLMKPIAQQLRSRGFLSVFYLDDILLFGQSSRECSRNVKETRKLLEGVGLVLNTDKCNFVPSREIKFLGFLFDSKNFCLKLTREKRSQIYNLAMKFQDIHRCKIRKLAEFIGVLVAACPAIRYGTLYTKSLEREKFLALEESNGNYDSDMTISKKIIPDLKWWESNVMSCVNPIREDHFEMEIFSDASLTGWGVACDGERTHGFWDNHERKEHINFLELKAVFYGLKCFAKDKISCAILLRIDNTTALSYINRMGSIQYPKLSKLSKEIWQWCEVRNLWLFASYISSKENKDADAESRVTQSETEWEFANWAYESVESSFGRFDIDLFASNINSKCKKFISWHRDPEAWAVDAFTVPWTTLYFYAFPPFAIILRTIQKIISDKAEGVLIVPLWPTQSWYPLFEKLLVSEPIVFAPANNLLIDNCRQQHPLRASLSLVAGRLSGKRLA